MRCLTVIELGVIATLLLPLASEAKRVSYIKVAPCIKQQLSRYNYTGQEKEQELKEKNEILNYRARVYDSRLRKFLSPDKAQEQHGAYTYVASNPISYVDPEGEWNLF